MKQSILILCFTGCLSLCACSNAPNTETVKNVSLKRYMGLWYEIARIDHSFERGLVGCTAHYTMLKNGTVKVINAGYKDSLQGKYKEAEGVAKIPNPNNPGRLRVSFFGGIYSGYNILALDTVGYEYALVGGNSRNYLWILSRKPILAADIQLKLIEVANSRGYNVEKLIFPEQPILALKFEE